MELLTRNPDPQVRRIMLFQRNIPVLAGLLGLVLLWFTSTDPAGASPWTPLARSVLTACIIAIPVSFVTSLVLNVRRDRERKRE